MTSPARRSLSWQRRLLFSLALLPLTLVLLEVLLQAFYLITVGDFLFRRALPPIYAADPVRCYRVASDLEYVHRTNEFEIDIFTNSIGLRTDRSHREYPIEKPPDVYRILVTGPSFAFGWGADYDDIFPTLIERNLLVPNRRVEVMNLGTPSQGSAHQLCWLQKVGYVYRPDLVLHVSYGMEVNPVATQCRERLDCPTIEEGQLVPSGTTAATRVRAFFKRFAIVFYAYYAYNTATRPEATEDATRSLYAEGETATGKESNFDAMADTYVEHARAIRSFVGNDTEVAFLYLPFSFAVHPQDVGRFPGIRSKDVERIRNRIRGGITALKSRGVHVLDTAPALIASADTARLYYWLDIHLTPAGNRVVASQATEFLEPIISRQLGTRDRVHSPSR